MSLPGVSVFKFVGTVSLGLLTGLSYTLSTLTVPTLLALPSATTASRAFSTLATTARTQLNTLASISGIAFLSAFALSPRAFRHPYLLYTSIIVLSSRLVASDRIAPYLISLPTTTTTGGTRHSAASTTSRQRSKDSQRAAARRMEMSYDMINSDAHSEATLDSASDRSLEEDSAAATPGSDPNNVNGEEVRGEVEGFLKKQVVSTAVAGLGFVMAVIGIWGDGTTSYVSETFVNVIEI